MEENKLKNTIAQRIVYYRKLNNMTQAELAEKLNYSDKSVSKWERGEGLPDVVVLAMMAELFGVTVNDLISGDTAPKKPTGRLPVKDRILIPMMAVGLVLVAASIVYLVLRLVFPDMQRLWLIYIYAVPACCVVALVLLKLWWTLPARFVCVSLLLWSSAAAVYVTLSLRHIQEIFIPAAAIQAVVILWYLFKGNFRKRRARRKAARTGAGGGDAGGGDAGGGEP
jgi:transcriptional regulator with XRE-family HTH domain